jgi:hypothetical protein
MLEYLSSDCSVTWRWARVQQAARFEGKIGKTCLGLGLRRQCIAPAAAAAALQARD